MRSGQILQFPLSRGLDEDGNAKAHTLAALKTGNNIRWPKAGVIGKRWGAKPLGNFDANQAPNITRFLTRGSELAVVRSTGTVNVYDAVNHVVSGVTAEAPKTQLDWTTLVDDETGVACTDAVVSGSIVVHAWVSGDPTRLTEATPVPTTSGNLYVQVINRETRQVLVMPQRIAVSDVQHVRVLLSTFSGNKAFVLFSAGATIRYVCVDIDALTVGSAATLKSDRVVYADHAIFGKFDALVKSNASVAFVYERNTSASSAMASVNCSVAGATLTVTSTVDYSGDGTWLDAKAIAVTEDVSGQQIIILYFRSNTVRVRSIDVLTLAAVAAATTAASPVYASQISLSVTAANTACLAWSGYETSSSRLAQFVSEVWTVSSGSVTATTRTKRRTMGFGLASRLFTLGGVIHAFAVDGRDGEDDGSTNSRTTDPSTYLLKVPTSAFSSSISGYPPHPLGGKVDHDIGGVFQNGTLPTAVAVDSNTVYGLLPFQADAAQKSWNWRTGLRFVRATQTASLMKDRWRSVTVGQESYITGAYLAAWDGRTVFDYGMRTVNIVLVQEAGANTGHIANGTYIYQFAPGYRSRAGMLHRGPLSDQITLPIGSGPSSGTTIKLCSHGPDGKQTETTGFANTAGSGSYVDPFRSTANGSVLYQLSMAPRYNVVVNDPTAATIDLTDTAWDSDIGLFSSESPNPGTIALSTRPEPYTASGEVEDCQPPAPLLMHLHGGRIFLVIGDRRTIWYSKDFRENPGIAPGFNPTQIELYDQDITALASMDEKRIVFWSRGIWYVYGDGPAVDGSDNRFSAPTIIQSDVGCSNPRSVVTTPMGVIFQSDSDLYVLQRNLEVVWLGKDARDTLASYPSITSAVLVASENEIRFTCNNAAGSAGIMLVFDYQRRTWFTRSYSGVGPLYDAVLVDGTYYFAQGAAVWYEDTTVNYDVISSVNTFVASTVELEAIGPSGPVGWQRIRIAKPIGQAMSNFSLSVAIARDYASSYEQTETFAAGSAVTTPGTHMRAEVAPTINRMQAVQLKFTDAAPSNTTLYPIGNGGGFQLEGVALLVQPKSGLPRDTSTRRGG